MHAGRLLRGVVGAARHRLHGEAVRAERDGVSARPSDQRLVTSATKDQLVFTITEKAPTRAFSWLKAPTSAFTFKTLLRHYAKQALSTYCGVKARSA